MPTQLPTYYPLGAPEVVGDEITVDLMLNEPERITQAIIDLTALRLTLVTEMFATPQGARGGAVIFQVLDENAAFTERDVEYVEPANEFPLITGERQPPRTARIAKYGGKDFITDEARDRNDIRVFAQLAQKMANTMVRKTHQRGVDVVNAAIAEFGRTEAGNNWSAVVVGGSGQTTSSAWPDDDFGAAIEKAELDELGYVYDGVGLHPSQMRSLRNIYASTAGGAERIFSDYGLTPNVSTRWPIGTATFYARGMVGGIRTEKPLGTETWREPSTQRTWAQIDARNLFFVDQPLALYRLTGLAG